MAANLSSNEHDFNDTCCFRAPTKGLRVIWEITHRCNQQCLHCLITSINQELPIEKLNEIAIVLIKDKIKDVILTGGEPLLHPACLDIAVRLASAGMDVDLITNAVLVTPQIASLLASYKINCSISLDGPNAIIHDRIRGVEGAFSRAVRGIEYLSNESVDIQALMSVTTFNFRHIHETIELAIRLGCSMINLCGLISQGRATINKQLWLAPSEVLELKNDLAEARKTFGDRIHIRTTRLFGDLQLNQCKAGQTLAHIDPVGKVNPCPFLLAPQDDRLYLPHYSIKEIVNGPTFTELKSRVAIPSLVKTVACPKECVYFLSCGRGCRGIAGEAPDPLCELKDGIEE